MARRDMKKAFVAELKKQPYGKRNITEAAIRAGYSPNSADRQGSRLLNNDEEIKAEIAEWDRKQSEKIEKDAGITKEWVVNQIKGIVEDPGASNKDKLRGLELLGKVLDIFDGKREQEQQTVRVVFEDPEMEAWGE